jgi:hypothetical protein
MKTLLPELKSPLLIGLVFSVAFFEVGCVSPSQREDPLASLDSLKNGMGRFPDQSVTVVMSQHMQNALDYLAAKSSQFGGPPDLSPTREVVARLKRVLSANFKSFQFTTNLSQARPETDLTMILDMRVTLGQMSGQNNSLELKGTFVDHNQQPYETVTGVGSSTMPFPAFETKLPQAAAAAFAEFNNNLRAIPRDKLGHKSGAEDSRGNLLANPESSFH